MKKKSLLTLIAYSALTTTTVGFVTGGIAINTASAAIVQISSEDLPGKPNNDCSGFFGSGFSNCDIGNPLSETVSDSIIKFDDGLGVSEISDNYNATVDGSEFSFSELGNSNGTGTWSYAPTGDDPGIRFWAAKAGPGFNLFFETDNLGGVCNSGSEFTLDCLNSALPLTGGEWETPFNNKGEPRGLSHLTFYNGDGTIVPPPPVTADTPEPGSILGLLAFGLIGTRSVLKGKVRK